MLLIKKFQYSEELSRFLCLLNCVYILILKNGSYYIGSAVNCNLLNRYRRHECFTQSTFKSVYLVLVVDKNVSIDAFVIERFMQNYAAFLLKVPKSKIYKCGANGFVCTEKQMKIIIAHLLSDLYFKSIVTVNDNILGLAQFNKLFKT